MLGRHIREVHSNKPKHMCKMCSRQFSRASHLRDHMTRMHTHVEERPRYPGTVPGCGKSFLGKSFIKRHFNMEHATNPVRFNCTLCPKQFKTKQNLLVDIGTHTTQKCYKCPTCEKSFACTANLKNHHKIHQHKSTREIFQCALCPLTFISEAGIRHHTNRSHGNRVFQCTFCDKKFKTTGGLKYHVKTSHDTNASPNFPCEKCHFKFWSRSSLSRHSQQVHDRVKKYRCYFCGYKFFDFRDLSTHCRRRHTMEK
ncbi:gastrula zinc finger protein XlCGF49.1-like [Folsomia candida]|nr:gastrula zinc finger protein XlCGF49.1-like [Folsomia candida]